MLEACLPPVPPQTAEDRVREDVRLLAEAHPPFAEPRAGQSRDAGAKGRGAVGRTSGTQGWALGARGASFTAQFICRESAIYEGDFALGHAGSAHQRCPRAGGLPEDPGCLLIMASPTQRAPMFRLPRGARGAGPWSERMETGFHALLRGLPVRWCPGICVSGVAPSQGNGFLHWPVPLLRERPVWDEGRPACFDPIRGLTSESEPSSLLPLCAGRGGRVASGC